MRDKTSENVNHTQALRPAKQYDVSEKTIQLNAEPIAPAYFNQTAEFIPTTITPNASDLDTQDSNLNSSVYRDDSTYDDGASQSSLFKASRASGAQKFLFAGLTLFTTAAIAQLISNIINHWGMHNWLSLLFDIGLLSLASGGIFSILNEIRKLKRLRNQLAKQTEAQALIDADQHNGAGKEFCHLLAEQSGLAKTKHQEASLGFQYFLSIVDDTHSDAEVLQLYHQYVLKPLDQKALKLIEKNMLESGLLVAVSPLAIVDMLFVAWRNIRLVNQIAEVYGIEISYWARIRLFRQVLINIAFVGGAELLSELGSDVLSQDLLSRFSTRAAQGIGAGFLTARLGLQTMKLCRPIPFIDSQPRLKDLRSQLISKLGKYLKKN